MLLSPLPAIALCLGSISRALPGTDTQWVGGQHCPENEAGQSEEAGEQEGGWAVCVWGHPKLPARETGQTAATHCPV